MRYSLPYTEDPRFSPAAGNGHKSMEAHRVDRNVDVTECDKLTIVLFFSLFVFASFGLCQRLFPILSCHQASFGLGTALLRLRT